MLGKQQPRHRPEVDRQSPAMSQAQGLTRRLPEASWECTSPCTHVCPSSLPRALSSRGFHNNNIKAIPEKAFMGNPLLQTM